MFNSPPKTHCPKTMIRSGCVNKDCEALSELIGKEGCSQLIKFAMEVPWGQWQQASNVFFILDAGR